VSLVSLSVFAIVCFFEEIFTGFLLVGPQSFASISSTAGPRVTSPVRLFVPTWFDPVLHDRVLQPYNLTTCNASLPRCASVSAAHFLFACAWFCFPALYSLCTNLSDNRELAVYSMIIPIKQPRRHRLFFCNPLYTQGSAALASYPALVAEAILRTSRDPGDTHQLYQTFLVLFGLLDLGILPPPCCTFHRCLSSMRPS
jgi:hypothetical protein